MVYGMAGEAYTSSTLPISTTLPPYMMATRSARPATTPRSCVTSTTAAPVMSRAVLSTSRICACTVTSSAVVGSSARITFGWLAIASAIITRWRIPPENSWGYDCARSAGRGMPTISSSSTARCNAASFEMSLCIWSASAICRPMVCTGLSADSGSWKTIAMSLPRYFDIALSSRLRRLTPS